MFRARGYVASSAPSGRSQRQMFLRCTTASYHAGDFRKEKMKIEAESDLAGKQTTAGGLRTSATSG
jgi:hypothetical protein